MKAAAVLVAFASMLRAADIPVTLVSDNEAEPIRSAIIRKEAWTMEAVHRLRADADRRMKGDSGAPNGAAFNAVCDAIFSLGTAAYFLDDARYARRAERLAGTAFINPGTRYDPATSAPAASAADGAALIRAVQGMEFLAHSGQWSGKSRAAVRQWFEEYLRGLNRKEPDVEPRGMVESAWWTAQAAAAATFVGDADAERRAFESYRNHVFPALARAGDRPSPVPEGELDALAIVCRIAQVHGADLWTLRNRNGVTIAGLIDAIEPALSEPKRRQYAGAYFLAFAGMGLNRPDYIALLRKLERPDNAWLALVDLLVGRWEASGHQTRH